MPGTYLDYYVVACRLIRLELCKLNEFSKGVSSPATWTGNTVVNRAFKFTMLFTPVYWKVLQLVDVLLQACTPSNSAVSGTH